MNILLVRPKPHKDSINLQSFMICEPLELEYISSYIESFGHNVEIIDMLLEKKPLSSFIQKHRPDIVGFTAYLPHVQIIKDYSKSVKEVDSTICTIVGGIHAEVVPQDFEDSNIDYIIKANGLKTFKEIIDSIQRKNEKEEIAGVWRNLDKVYTIDTEFKYPFPDREKTAQYRNKYNYIYHEKCATIKTSFGCPYKCEFCFCVQITQSKYFERDIKNVIEEIKTIKEKNVFIVDDNFLVSVNRIKEFCSLLDENKISKNFIMFGRADFIVNNEEVIELLKAHGLKAIFVGIESFKEEDLNNFNKRTTVDMNVRAVRILEKLGLECYSGIIVGIDWEKRDFDNLIKFLNIFEMPMLNIQPISPMPGTPTYNKYQNQIVVPREKYELWDMAHLLIEPSKMSRGKFYYNILRTYYMTALGLKAHIYIIKRYGLKIYWRTFKGSLYITWQYLKLIIKN